MQRWRTIVDRIIDEARERGEFELTEGKGQPLKEDHYEVYAGNRAMAHKVLANSGHAPPFLMKKREIEERLETERARLLRYALRRRRLHHEAALAGTPELAEALRQRAEEDWVWALHQFEKVIPEINHQIEIFNLMNKIPSLFKMKVRLEWEMERVEKECGMVSGAIV